jgi:hypothetical protein
MTAARQEILKLLETMSDRYPEWRFGQLVANVAGWAKQPTEPGDSGVWDVEDDEFLAAIQGHLDRRTLAN